MKSPVHSRGSGKAEEPAIPVSHQLEQGHQSNSAGTPEGNSPLSPKRPMDMLRPWPRVLVWLQQTS